MPRRAIQRKVVNKETNKSSKGNATQQITHVNIKIEPDKPKDGLGKTTKGKSNKTAQSKLEKAIKDFDTIKDKANELGIKIPRSMVKVPDVSGIQSASDINGLSDHLAMQTQKIAGFIRQGSNPPPPQVLPALPTPPSRPNQPPTANFSCQPPQTLSPPNCELMLASS